MHLVTWFPYVVTFEIPFPFDEILKSSRPSVVVVINYMFNLVFFFSVEKVRWWPREVGSMHLVFVIW